MARSRSGNVMRPKPHTMALQAARPAAPRIASLQGLRHRAAPMPDTCKVSGMEALRDICVSRQGASERDADRTGGLANLLAAPRSGRMGHAGQAGAGSSMAPEPGTGARHRPSTLRRRWIGMRNACRFRRTTRPWPRGAEISGRSVDPTSDRICPAPVGLGGARFRPPTGHRDRASHGVIG